MQEEYPKDQQVAVVISEMVRPDRIADYEAWVKGIRAVMNSYPGYLGSETIRPSDHSHPEYVNILRFADYESLRHWRGSEDCRLWVEKLQDLIADTPVEEVHYTSGFDLWFSRPKARNLPEPAFYKQVVVGILAAYPLIILFHYLFQPFTGDWPVPLAIFASVIPISAFMAWPVLPLLSKWLRPWLYPGVGKKKN